MIRPVDKPQQRVAVDAAPAPREETHGPPRREAEVKPRPQEPGQPQPATATPLQDHGLGAPTPPHSPTPPQPQAAGAIQKFLAQRNNALLHESTQQQPVPPEAFEQMAALLAQSPATLRLPMLVSMGDTPLKGTLMQLHQTALLPGTPPWKPHIDTLYGSYERAFRAQARAPLAAPPGPADATRPPPWQALALAADKLPPEQRAELLAASDDTLAQWLAQQSEGPSGGPWKPHDVRSARALIGALHAAASPTLPATAAAVAGQPAHGAQPPADPRSGELALRREGVDAFSVVGAALPHLQLAGVSVNEGHTGYRSLEVDARAQEQAPFVQLVEFLSGLAHLRRGSLLSRIERDPDLQDLAEPLRRALAAPDPIAAATAETDLPRLNAKALRLCQA